MALDLTKLTCDFGDVYAEASACRSDRALFDFSFMARARLSGGNALGALARLTPRPLDDLPQGRIRYALRLNSENHVVADLTIWNLGEGCYEVMSGRRVDVTDLISFCDMATHFEDLSESTIILSVQGSNSLAALADLTDHHKLVAIPYFGHAYLDLAGVACLVGRLGYTGERGFEIVAAHEDGERLWQLLVQRARPAGFAAADRLRIEAGFPLFANEFRYPVTAEEAGLARFAVPASMPPRVLLMGFRAAAPTKPVLWQPTGLAALDLTPGHITVTSACYSSVCSCILGLGYVPADTVRVRTIAYDTSSEFGTVQLEQLPFYDPGKIRPRGPWRNANETG
jgi:glycine cleavage system aminomethyltransferase T